METKKQQNRIWLVDALKGVAALSVIIQHIFLPAEIKNALLLPFWCNLAVPIFVVISGFTFTLSSKRLNDKKPKNYLKEYFSLNRLTKKFTRICIPFFIAYIIEIVGVGLKSQMPSIKHIAKCLFIGGFNAPGSYYIPVLIQLIVVFPFIKLIYNKLKNFSFVAVAIIQIAYELVINTFDISFDLTRLLAIRYFFFLLCGIWLYYNYEKVLKKSILAVSITLGLGWILLIAYFAYEPKFIFKTWATTSIPTAFWFMPIIIVLFNKLANKPLGYKSIMCKLGEASYHIYLTQMVYFLLIGNRFENDLINAVLALLASSIAGYAFYYLESKIKIKKPVKK